MTAATIKLIADLFAHCCAVCGQAAGEVGNVLWRLPKEFAGSPLVIHPDCAPFFGAFPWFGLKVAADLADDLGQANRVPRATTEPTKAPEPAKHCPQQENVLAAR